MTRATADDACNDEAAVCGRSPADRYPTTACALGWTPRTQGTCTYRLEARFVRFYAARPALRGSRTSEILSASDARSPPIGVIFPAERGSVYFVRLRLCVGSPTVFSRELGGATTAVGHTPKFVFLILRPFLWKDLLWVMSALPARGSALT